MSFINLGCGPVFLDNSDWLNLDFSPASPSVQKANLLDRLPIDDCSVSVVYSSHFLEHIPRPGVGGFLTECFRILEGGGVIRLVLPDFENMVVEYLRMRGSCEHDKANFVVLEIIDQCVRREPGGEMGRLYGFLKQRNDETTLRMASYIRERVGEDLRSEASFDGVVDGGLRAMARRIASALPRRLRNHWIQLIVCALPTAFREQNVSLASVGERHHWLWDLYQIRTALEAVGFERVTRQSADRSVVAGFPFYPLDLDADGRPRKGASSMYIEAFKK
jgi:hypothetical protein